MSVCTNCANAATVGNEAVSVCTECGTAAVAGASLSLPIAIGAVLITAGVLLLSATARRMFRRTPRITAA